jgi:hypothetical protein
MEDLYRTCLHLYMDYLLLSYSGAGTSTGNFESVCTGRLWITYWRSRLPLICR